MKNINQIPAVRRRVKLHLRIKTNYVKGKYKRFVTAFVYFHGYYPGSWIHSCLKQSEYDPDKTIPVLKPIDLSISPTLESVIELEAYIKHRFNEQLMIRNDTKKDN